VQEWNKTEGKWIGLHATQIILVVEVAIEFIGYAISIWERSWPKIII